MHRLPSAYDVRIHHTTIGTALAWPIPQYSVELDHGCTSRIYFDNADDNMKLTLYNVTLTPRKPCEHNNKCDCSKTNVLNEVYYVVFFFNKISLLRYFIEKYINIMYSAA